MKRYQVHITGAAERDMRNAFDYIEFALKNPRAADALLDEAETKINALAAFPEQFPIIEDAVLSSWRIRFTLIQNYLAFYRIDERDSVVYILRFLYGKSDWISILKQGDFLPPRP